MKRVVVIGMADEAIAKVVAYNTAMAIGAKYNLPKEVTEDCVCINGKWYKPRPKRALSGHHSKMLNIALAYISATGYNISRGIPDKPQNGINIIEEYAKIDLKQSNLSRSLREGIVKRFNMLFEPLDIEQDGKEEGKE